MVWQIKWVDPMRANLNKLFEDGWEPFAVDGGCIYLRRPRSENRPRHEG